MLTTVLLVLAGLLAVFLIAAALQSADFRIVRSATVSAPAAVVFAQVNDLQHWQNFSPWAKLDPQAIYTYTGPAAGPGASCHWTGNAKIGEGRMTITESRPAEVVRMKLEFIRPFANTNLAEFAFAPAGDRTTVTWSMTGQRNFLMKAFGLIMNMDKMVGGDFERGLANLEAQAQAAAKK